jgi:hypothetical protein
MPVSTLRKQRAGNGARAPERASAKAARRRHKGGHIGAHERLGLVGQKRRQRVQVGANARAPQFVRLGRARNAEVGDAGRVRARARDPFGPVPVGVRLDDRHQLRARFEVSERAGVAGHAAQVYVGPGARRRAGKHGRVALVIVFCCRHCVLIVVSPGGGREPAASPAAPRRPHKQPARSSAGGRDAERRAPR